MRKALAKIDNERDVFTGIFVRFGTKRGFKGQDLPTILMKEIRDKTGKVVADHLWFNLTKGFCALGPLKEGDKIEFYARVKAYVKGYQGYRDDVYKPVEPDYKLSHPTKIRIMR